MAVTHQPAGAALRLLERDDELRMLEAARRDAWAGTGSVVLLEGRAGAGKSALLAEAASAAGSEGFAILTARASELEHEYAFGVVRQLFETALGTAPHWLDGAARSAHLAFDDQAIDRGDEVGADNVSHAVLHGLYWVTVNACADRPTVLVIDDAHWCDRPSLRFLAYLGRRLAGLRLLVLVGLRTTERVRVDLLIGDLAREPSAVLIEPAPLSETAVAELLETRLGAPPRPVFAAACRRATGGNPLLLDELARAMHADGIHPGTAGIDVVADLGPRAVSRTVLMRLARLGDDAAALARAVAVLGEGGDLALLSGMTELGGPAIEGAARALIQAEILRPDPPLGFVHPLVRDAVYQDLSTLEREAHHARAASLLRAAGRPSEGIAAHALVLPPSGQQWVVDALHHAARIAASRGAAESAVAYLRRALQEPPAPDRHPQLVLELGMAEALANEPLEATTHLRAAYATSSEPALRARVAEVLARMLIFTNPPADAVAVARQAQRDLPAELADAQLALAAIELYAVHFGADDVGIADRLARARRATAGDGPGARMVTAVVAWDGALTGASAAECTELAMNALADGVLVANDPSFMTLVAAAVLTLADRDEALDVWADVLVEGHTRGSQLAVSGVHLWQGWNWLQRGALAEAEDALNQYVVDTELRGGERESGMAYSTGFLTRVLVEKGDLARARTVATRAGVVTPGSDGDLQSRRGVLELLLAEGRWSEAWAALGDYRARLRRVVNPAWAPVGSLEAAALCGLGRTEEAVASADREVVAARRWGAAGTVGAALRALGTALDAHRAPECLEVLEEAVATSAPSPARLEHAKNLAALGSAMRRRGRPTEARGPLGRAADLATVCGASRLASAAVAELHAAGGRRTNRGPVGRDALTPSERRVASLAAAGRTNKAIAQELFVTPKTVEVHLSSTYRKLGITSRGELASVEL